MKHYKYEDIYIGLEESFDILVTNEMEREFRNLTGDENPLHYDDNFARAVGFDRHVAYGMLIASFLSTLAGIFLPGKYSLIHSIEQISFMKPVYTGDRLHISGKVYDKIDGLNIILINVTMKKETKTAVKCKMKVLIKEQEEEK